jgi:hypothetical protein
MFEHYDPHASQFRTAAVLHSAAQVKNGNPQHSSATYELGYLMVILIEPELGQFGNVAAFPRRAAARHPMAVKSQPACPQVPVNIMSKENQELSAEFESV